MDTVFSVVIPNYNSFHLMGKCLRFLEEQTYQNIEVVIVDDCSTDDSYERLLEWASSTKLSAKIIRQEKNVGPGAARNRGLDVCTGDYVTFIDADDFIEKDSLEQVLPYTQAAYDTIIFDAVIDTKDGSVVLPMVESNSAREGKLEPRLAFVLVGGSTCGKVYRVEALRNHNVRFGEYYRFEDIPFTKAAVGLSESVYYYPKALYHYVEVGTSIINSGAQLWNPDKANNADKIVFEHLGDKGFELEIEAWRMREIYSTNIFLMIHADKPKKEIKALLSRAYSRKNMKNPYIRLYTKSRYLMMRVFASKCLPLIKLMYKMKYRNSLKS